ncbi:Transcriptional repressor IclR (plasmid) [Pseudoseohaeicola sp. NH-UV-7]|uniref:IclR family transcriptional regulator n=1 Tax=Sulfitobacter sp. TBRI5 TaxID=2989732 RepID=UPI003A61088E
MPDDTSDTTGNIPTNLRVLLLLEEVAKSGVPITPTEVNTRIGLPKPTVHRLFATMEREGFLQRDIDGKSYSPGPRLRRFSINVLSSLRIRTARVTVLTALAEEIGETCNITTPDRDCMIYLDRVETKWPLRIQLPVGTTVPFHCTASGKMYLSTLRPSHLRTYIRSAKLTAQTEKTLTDPDDLAAEIKRVQERGYSTDNEEFMDAMVAIAVPISDPSGRMLATLAVHAPTHRISLEGLQAHLPLITKTAQTLMTLIAEE